MKKLLLALTLATFALTAQAQSSNVVQSIRLTFIAEDGTTNNTTISVSAREADGFLLNYLKDVQTAEQNTNAVPTFQNSIRGTVNTFLLKPLAQQSRDNQKRQTIGNLSFVLENHWDDLTAQQRNQLAAIAAAFATP